MPKFIDLTGQKFGKWTVLKRAENKNKSIYWTCQCECGTIKDVRGGHLKSGASQSCGCLKKERAIQRMQEIGEQPKDRFIDMTGQKIGRWTVLERVENNLHGSAMWKCECECGNIGIVKGSALRAKKSLSCGKCHTYKDNLALNDLANKKFGKLTVLRLLQETDSTGRHRLWECQCECGNIIKVARPHLLNGNTKSCGCIQSYGEYLIEKILKENNIEYIKQKTFPTCIFPDTNKLAKFDFYIPDKNYLIEFDGVQHFKTENKGWDTIEKFKKTLEHDAIKNQWCKDNNIPLIRIPYTKYDTLSINDLILK